ncbi:MAG: cyclodeaminase/cyclohydrolase family protein [Lachnospiraceae bacterium]|nr:cyclodeaminase/cyclohydrolase family protein [Lachnospiraceae bacterium]
MEYRKETIEKFLEKLGSSDSMPGGGVASSLVAANGISLILMVCNLTIGKERYKENEQLVILVKDEAEKLKEKFLELMDKDAETFKVMEKVFAMPNFTEEEKSIRKEKMQEACKICCETPREMIEYALKGIELANSILGKSNKSAESDLIVSAIFLKAAIKGAWENIAINLKYINDEKFVKDQESFKQKIEDLIKQ